MTATASREGRPAAPYRKGWCPGALRPMETGDGLLVRVRPRRGRLSLDQAAVLAECATLCGAGAIGLSARANLHLRGITERTLPHLHARLADAGLIDADPEIERLRNIVSSPLDDIDPEALVDLAPGLASLERRLAADEDLRPLPAKFGFVLDAEGRLPLADIEADIRFEAAPGGFRVLLAGDDGLSGRCALAETGETAARLGRAFLRLAGSGEGAPRRMRALVERIGAKAVFVAAGLEAAPRARSERRASLADLLGVHQFGANSVVGAAAAFGEIEAGRFRALIERARMLGASGVRLTPWRAFLIVGLDPGRARAMLASIVELGFVARAGEPILRVAACPGGPRCLHGFQPARDDAARWAGLLPRGDGVVLHVSGCAKGCARAATTAATLTATAEGYDLVIAGKAGDQPARRGLTGAEAAQFIASVSTTLFAGGRLDS